MSTITIPASLAPAFGVTEPTRVCDESGKILGYYTPRREATPEDYEWARQQFTKEEIEASRNSGPGRSLQEILADLQKRQAK